ncbi:MAG: HD domain-containing protein [Pyrinomonadaceae bacterium]
MSNFLKLRLNLRTVILLTLLLVGIAPMIVIGWILSDRSGRELRAAEGRYQTQLVQDKALQIENFGRNYANLVRGYGRVFESYPDQVSLLSSDTQEKLGKFLGEYPSILALYIKPLQGESVSAFRSGILAESEVHKFSQSALGALDDRSIAFGSPSVAAETGELVLPIAAPIKIKGELVAAIVGLVSMREVTEGISEKEMTEADLWDLGLPIVFVVDEKGAVISHPNSAYESARKSMKGLRIVDEWTQTKEQIQSALLPFNTEFQGVEHEMIGAYSTANLEGGGKYGVIVMQDADKALASVGEMRQQVWFISLMFSLIALVMGLILSVQITKPLSNLVEAAKSIASGDLSKRIQVRKIGEIADLGHAFNQMTDELDQYINDLATAARENKELFVGTVKALAAAIDGKDRYTRGHSERVSRVSVAIGQRMNLAEDELEKLRISALLHDVGKISIDDAILKKPAALTNEEFEVMKRHPQEGYKIMKNIPAMKEFLPGMYMHHEMVNGKGYPQGLSDEDIPLQAKIVSVADTFDAMTIDRPYQKGMQLEEALDRIKSFVGTRYDLHVVDALIRAVREGQIGVGTVKLKNFDPKEESDMSKIAS